MDRPTTIDLFCGAGGITEGFRQAGFHCLFANDFNANAVETFQHKRRKLFPITLTDYATLKNGSA